jgi:hypothetical protein
VRGRVIMTVAATRTGTSFDLDVAGADALAAFHHPFVYAGARHAAAGAAGPAARELQPLS